MAGDVRQQTMNITLSLSSTYSVQELHKDKNGNKGMSWALDMREADLQGEQDLPASGNRTKL